MYRHKIINFLLKLYLLHLVQYAHGQGDCTINGITTESQWINGLTINITDTDSGLVYERKASNVVAITQLDGVEYALNHIPYVNFSLQNDMFTVSLLDDFKNYEANERSLQMASLVWFQCNNGTRTLRVRFKIQDTNNHAPIFLAPDSYNYSIILPVAQGQAVSFTNHIVVNDNDLTNYKVEPRIQENDYFDLNYLDADYTSRNHRLVLTAKKPIFEFDTISLFMVVTDIDYTGFPPISTIAQLTVNKHPFSTTDPKPLEFENRTYKGSFDSDETLVKFKKPIKMAKGYASDIVFTLEDEGSMYFSVEHSNNTFQIVPSSVEILEEIIMRTNAVLMTLIATKDNNTASTVLSIRMLKDPNCELPNLPADSWENGVTTELWDNFFGDTLILATAKTTGIIGYRNEMYELNDPPYVTPSWNGEGVVFSVNPDKFKDYEIVETRQNFAIYVDLKCKRNNRTIKVTHIVKDTNNHSPTISSPRNLTYEIITPMRSGYSVSRTYGDLVISDVDITNYAVLPEIETNDFMVVKINGKGPGVREYSLELVTKRNITYDDLPLTTTLRVSDVDLTPDPRRYVNMTITLVPKPIPSI